MTQQRSRGGDFDIQQRGYLLKVERVVISPNEHASLAIREGGNQDRQGPKNSVHLDLIIPIIAGITGVHVQSVHERHVHTGFLLLSAPAMPRVRVNAREKLPDHVWPQRYAAVRIVRIIQKAKAIVYLPFQITPHFKILAESAD